ncbi:unnamed protein product [Arabis nemorensis]|uniref:Uncharacterized protein n=1 Tax=Arabis nemorensis TaxID=586526 RepID=A0A565CSD1_9BRAS|nr:unnamed protein product [Arabis nemorensis]
MEVIDKWVAEFFIRRQQNPRVSPTNLLSAMKFGDSPDCIKLKISSVLRDISNSLIKGTLDEGTLDLLEILEKLMLQQHSVLTESHKSAYCWTAVECTVRFMWPLSASDGFFNDALKRIWTKRIWILKESGSGLVTYDLLKWEADLEVSLEDPELYQRIRETNVRYTAISFLNQLLKEQWELLGSSALELVAQRTFLKRNAQNVDNRGDPNPVDESMRRLKSDNIKEGGTSQEEEGNENNRGNASDVEGVGCLESDNIKERGTSEEEEGNENNRENANDVEGVGCLESDGFDKVDAADEEETIGGPEPSLDKGDKTAARELKELLLEIQGHIEPPTRQEEQEPNNGIDHSVDVTPQPAMSNRTRTGGQDRNETPDNANEIEKGSNSQGTWSGRVRPRLPTPVPLNVSPLKKENSNVRRPKKFWTPEEVEALREGVKEYGKSWKDIKNANPAVFAERTEVDLKDKWRNLVR